MLENIKIEKLQSLCPEPSIVINDIFDLIHPIQTFDVKAYRN